VSVEEEGQDKGDEEQNDVYDAEHPGCLQHGTVLVDVEGPSRAALSAIVSKRPKIDIDRARLEIGAIIVTDSAKVPDSCDECADEAEVDKGNEQSRSPGGAQPDKCCNRPGAGEDGYDEEDEDEGGRQLVVVVEAVDKPSLSQSVSIFMVDVFPTYQHANDRDQEHNLRDSPEGEE
jgi:hypothetical protein